jgi:hypothetical protein
MDIALPANRNGIAKPTRHRLQGCFEILLPFFRRGKRGIAKRLGSEHGAGPCAEVFCSEVFARDFANVLVHISGFHTSEFSRIVEILKEFISGQVSQLFHNLGESLVLEVDCMLHPALTAEKEMHFRTSNIDVPVLKCCQTDGSIVRSILFVPDSNERFLH